MKKTRLLPILFLSLVMMASCSKEGTDLNINDPQRIKFLDIIPQELLEAFGEEYIHFGHTPPDFDKMVFYVDSLEYLVCKHYVYDYYTHQPIISTYPLEYDPIWYYHYFYNHIDNIINDSILYYAPAENDRFMADYDSIYLIGSGDDFTAYFEEHSSSMYHPTNGILISGTVVKDAQGQFIGIKDYRMGKMIISYEEDPPFGANVYLVNSLEVKKHLKPIAPAFIPDTCTIWQQYN